MYLPADPPRHYFYKEMKVVYRIIESDYEPQVNRLVVHFTQTSLSIWFSGDSLPLYFPLRYICPN